MLQHSKNIELDLGIKVKLHMTATLYKEIEYAHKTIGATEWNGVVFYTIDEGGLDDLARLKITAHHFYPLGLGHPAGVTYHGGPEIFAAYELWPEVDPEKNPLMMEGTIHTHHSGSTYFSGTDQNDLFTNTPSSYMYFSLIVNFAMKPTAKISLPVTMVKKSYKLANGHSYDVSEQQDTTIATAVCDITMDVPKEAKDPFNGKIQELKKQNRSSKGIFNSHSGIDYQPKKRDTFIHQGEINRFLKDLIMLGEDNADARRVYYYEQALSAKMENEKGWATKMTKIFPELYLEYFGTYSKRRQEEVILSLQDRVDSWKTRSDITTQFYNAIKELTDSAIPITKEYIN